MKSIRHGYAVRYRKGFIKRKNGFVWVWKHKHAAQSAATNVNGRVVLVTDTIEEL